MYRVVISGFYGFNHLGDEAILQAIINQIRADRPDIAITVLSADPEQTARVFSVDAVNRSSFSQVNSAIKSADALVSGGGGLFQDVTSVFSMWYYAGIILLAMFAGKPVYVFANGIGPVSNWFNRLLLRFTMNRVRKISVRDTRSKQELINMGVRKDIQISADPVFSLTPASVEECTLILEREGGFVTSESPLVGFSIRSSVKKTKCSSDPATIFAQAADKVADDVGATIVLFPFYIDEDLPLAREIASRMRNKPIIISGSYIPSQLLGVFGLMKMNVCVRLHGLIFSARMGVPMVAVSYDPKVDSFMNMMDMEQVSDYSSLDLLALEVAINNTWDHLTEIAEAVKIKVEDLEKLAVKSVREIVGELGARD